MGPQRVATCEGNFSLVPASFLKGFLAQLRHSLPQPPKRDITRTLELLSAKEDEMRVKEEGTAAFWRFTCPFFWPSGSHLRIWSSESSFIFQKTSGELGDCIFITWIPGTQNNEISSQMEHWISESRVIGIEKTGTCIFLWLVETQPPTHSESQLTNTKGSKDSLRGSGQTESGFYLVQNSVPSSLLNWL